MTKLALIIAVLASLVAASASNAQASSWRSCSIPNGAYTSHNAKPIDLFFYRLRAQGDMHDTRGTCPGARYALQTIVVNYSHTGKLLHSFPAYPASHGAWVNWHCTYRSLGQGMDAPQFAATCHSAGINGNRGGTFTFRTG